jgi:hypothetical protein
MNEEEILKDLEDGPIFFYDKRSVGKWMPLLLDLHKRDLIDMELIVVDEQESYLEVKKR